MADQTATGLPDDGGPVRVCSECGVPKPLSEYSRLGGSGDKRRPDCQDCMKAARRGRGAKSSRIRRGVDPAGYRPRQPVAQTPAGDHHTWSQLPEVKEHLREYDAARREEERRQVFGHYGRVCACCGATENLTIDHIDGTGTEHREELFGRQTGGHHFYGWLIRNGFPCGYQTLCAPCNSSKRGGARCRLNHQLI